MMKKQIMKTAQTRIRNSEKCYKTRRQAKIDAPRIVLSEVEGFLSRSKEEHLCLRSQPRIKVRGRRRIIHGS